MKKIINDKIDKIDKVDKVDKVEKIKKADKTEKITNLFFKKTIIHKTQLEIISQTTKLSKYNKFKIKNKLIYLIEAKKLVIREYSNYKITAVDGNESKIFKYLYKSPFKINSYDSNKICFNKNLFKFKQLMFINCTYKSVITRNINTTGFLFNLNFLKFICCLNARFKDKFISDFFFVNPNIIVYFLLTEGTTNSKKIRSNSYKYFWSCLAGFSNY